MLNTEVQVLVANNEAKFENDALGLFEGEQKEISWLKVDSYFPINSLIDQKSPQTIGSGAY